MNTYQKVDLALKGLMLLVSLAALVMQTAK